MKNEEILTPEELNEMLVKEQLRILLIRGFNIYAKNSKDIMTKKHVETLINNEIEKILKEK